MLRFILIISFSIGTWLSALENSCCCLPSARRCLSPNEWGAAIDASLLVWQARSDGLAFAVKNHPTLPPDPNLYANMNAEMVELEFSWQPAFKLNFVIEMSNAWDFDARWTFYHNRSEQNTSSSLSASTTSGLYPLWMLPQANLTSPGIFGQAHALWQLHINTIDLILGADALLTSLLSLRLHGGLKAVCIDHCYTVKYFSGTISPVRTALENRCLGAGPRIGFDSKWWCGRGWSIAANMAGSCMLSHFSVKRSDSDITIQSSLFEAFYVFRPILEMLIGANWERCYGCRKQYIIAILAAYEVQYFWEQNLMRQLVAAPLSFLPFSSRGDLYCHGLTATLRLGF